MLLQVGLHEVHSALSAGMGVSTMGLSLRVRMETGCARAVSKGDCRPSIHKDDTKHQMQPMSSVK